MDALTSIIIGVLSSLIASFLFLFFLLRKIPSIKISKYIAKETYNGEIRYVFKLVNTGKRDIVDLQADLELATIVNVSGGIIYKGKNIKLIKTQCFSLSRYDKNDKEGNYAIRFVTKENLEEYWNNERDYMIFRVKATDSFSGFSKSFTVEYRNKRVSIKPGSHGWGLNLDVS